MKKSIILVLLVTLLMGCSDKDVKDDKNNENVVNEIENTIDNIEEESEEVEEEVITEFNAIGNTYTSTKNILDFAEGDVIYYNRGENPHIAGEYKEVDFASDLINRYLYGDYEVFNNVVEELNGDNEITLIDESEKNRLIEQTDFLREQMEIAVGNPIYYRLDEVIYNGQVEGGISLEVRGLISATDGYFISLSTFIVNIYEDGNILYASIN